MNYCGDISSIKRSILIVLTIWNLQLGAGPYIIGGWVPYWKAKEAIADATAHIDQIDHISPFSWELDHKCNLYNPFARNRTHWDPFFELCRSKHIKIVPTIFWTNTRAMDACLTHPEKSEQHINQIVSLVLKEKMDGININYERVSSGNRVHFLDFIQKLSQQLHAHNLVFYCTMGARTGDRTVGVLYNKHKQPEQLAAPKDKFKNVSVSLSPGTGEEAARFKAELIKCCDLFFIMGYDEWGKPFHYDKEALKSKYYMSHASHQWIEQAIQYSLTYVPAEKLMLGLPSYALEFHIIRKPTGEIDRFKKSKNLTTRDAIALAQKHNITPTHTNGHEKCFIYSHHGQDRYVCYLDSEGVADRVDLVKKYGIKGLYFFKIDAGHEPGMWSVLKTKLGNDSKRATTRSCNFLF